MAPEPAAPAAGGIGVGEDEEEAERELLERMTKKQRQRAATMLQWT